jgi:hypothetical protein
MPRFRNSAIHNEIIALINANPASTTEKLQDAVAEMFDAVTEVAYDDATGKFTIDFPAVGTGGFTQEQIEDFVAGMFSADSKVAYSDTTGKLTITVPGTSGSSSLTTVNSIEDLIAQAGAARAAPTVIKNIQLGSNITVSAPPSDSIPGNLLIHPNGKRFVISSTGNLEFEGRGFPDYVLAGTEAVIEGARSTYHRFEAHSDLSQINGTTNTFSTPTWQGWAAHGLVTGQQLRYYAAPETTAIGLVKGNYYYAIVISATAYKVATTYANAMAGTAEDLTGNGAQGEYHYFFSGDVRFTGDDYPLALAQKFFKTAGNSFQEQLACADFALQGKAAEIIAAPSAFNSHNGFLSHPLRVKTGTYQNDYNGVDSIPAVSMFPGASLVFENGAVINETSAAGRHQLFHAYDLNADMGEVNIRGGHIRGNDSGAHDTKDAGIDVGNASGGSITDVLFEANKSYVCTVGGYGDTGNIAKDFTVAFCRFKNAQSQVLFCPHGQNVRFLFNIFDCTDLLPNISAVLTDWESNNGLNRLVNCESSYNIYDLRDASAPFALFTALAVNSARTVGTKKFTARGNQVWGLANDGINTVANVQNSYHFLGIDDLTLEDNLSDGAYDQAVLVKNCANGRISRNRILRSTNGDARNAAIVLQACRNMTVEDNICVGGYSPTQFATRIIEAELLIHATSAGAVISHIDAIEHGVNAAYEHWIGGTVTFNNRDYAVLSVVTNTTNQNYTVSPAPGTVAALTFTVDPGTDIITTPANTYNAGARLSARSTGTLPAMDTPVASEGPLYVVDGSAVAAGTRYAADVFWIPLSPVTGKLARTLEDAVAAVPIPITFSSAGTGTHTLYPKVRTKFSSNTYRGNDCAVVLEEGGKSVNHGDNAGIGKTAIVAAASGLTVLTEADSGRKYKGSGIASFLLPPDPREGLNYIFQVSNNSSVRINVNADSTIYMNGGESEANGYIFAEAAGATALLEADGNGDWYAEVTGQVSTVSAWVTGSFAGSPVDINFAAIANGGSATASFSESPFTPDFAVNGIKHTNNAYAGTPKGFWSGGNNSAQYLYVNFAGSKTLKEIRLCTLAALGDGLNYDSNPTVGVTGISAGYGLTSYEIKYWNGSTWVSFPTPIDVTGNTLAYRLHAFAATVTTAIRVEARVGGTDNYRRVVEVEAFNRT